ncbi:MAG: hypothetical protein KC503_22960 [Myxococcales bacterium]|nr:hypothetical protein [Myxococcales bacterium]
MRVVASAAIAILLASCAKPKPPAAPPPAHARPSSPSSQPAARLPTAFRNRSRLAADHVRAELFVMSKCHFCKRAETGLLAVVEALGPRFDLQIHFVVTRGVTGAFRAMHGAGELRGNLLQLCAKRRRTPRATQLRFINCMSDDMRAIPANWRACARKLGLDANVIDRCASSDEGTQRLAASYARSTARHVGGAPTLFIGATRYSGRYQKRALLAAICAVMPGKKPTACAP